MLKLSTTINTIWPEQALTIIKEKGLSVKKLKNKFEHIYFPWDDSYNKFRFFYKLQIQELPLFIVRAANVTEIENFLNLAFRKKLTLRIIVGRHSSNIQDPNIYLDLSLLNEISLKQNLLSLGGGVPQGRSYLYVQEHAPQYYHMVSTRMTNSLANALGRHLENNNHSSYAVDMGNQPDVGQVGICSAGGISTLKRTFGLTSDTVKSFDIVIPPTLQQRAQHVHATRKHNPDLFWALKGGLAGNFGVVTNITYKLPEIGDVIMYSLTFPFDKAADVLKYWLDTATTRSNQYNEDIALFVNGETNGCEIGGLYVLKEDEQTLEAEIRVKRELKGLIKLGGTYMSKVSSYFDAVKTLAERRVYHPFSSSKVYMSSEKVDTNYIVQQLEKARQLSGTFLVAVDLLGGKIAEKSSTASAYWPRHASYFYELFAVGESSLDVTDLNAWTTDLFDHLYNINTDTVFVGFIIPKLKHHLEKYYGGNRFRLLEIKEKYDPQGVLNFNQGIVLK